MRKFIRTFSDHKTTATAVASSTGKVDIYWNTPDLNPALMGSIPLGGRRFFQNSKHPQPPIIVPWWMGRGILWQN